MQADDIMHGWLAGLSTHTQRSYSTAVRLFEAQTGVTWLAATANHVIAWRQAMADAGLQRSTIGQRLTALSSLYAFAMRTPATPPLVNANPVQAAFRRRPRAQHYANSQPLTGALVKRLLATCDQTTVSGARNYALLTMFIYTGWRADEVLRLRWGDLSTEGPHVMVAWSGKGNKEQLETLPATAYAALLAYLKLADRYPPAAADYLWQPLRTCNLANLRHVQAELPANRPISSAQANNILRHALRHAGLTDQQARRYHVHSLRHTFAAAARRGGMDLLDISRSLHHDSLDTTRLYLEALNRVTADTSAAVAAGLDL